VRIVSLLPSATEICFSLGLGEQVVGVTHECDFPPEALTKPKLTRSMLPESLQTHSNPGRSAEIDRHVRANVHQGSSLYALDSELLEQLAPDLIITQELCAVCAVSYEIVAGAAKRLRGDPRVISLEPATLEDVFGTIETVGQICGVSERATAVLAQLRSRVAKLRATTSAMPRPRTLLLEWPDPPMNAGHWIPDIIELAGGEPLLANTGGNSQKLEWNAIAEADPDAVLVAPCGYNLPNAKAAILELDAYPAWRTLRAVREGRVFAIDGNAYVSRPGPRLVDSAEILARALHGDVSQANSFEDALARV
jgi:iron complex transport system substrate-binding protein